jgi:DNA-binding transcriptional regulator GbsR (MarR family)
MGVNSFVWHFIGGIEGMQPEACIVNVSSFDLSKAITFSGIFSKVKLSPSARLVLRCLVDFWNPNKGLVFPGQKKIAEYTGSSDKSVTNAVNELRKENLIFTAGAAGGKLKYYFTAKFFELLKITEGNEKITDSIVKNTEVTTVKFTYHEQKKLEQNIKPINNNNSEIIILSNGFKVKTGFQKDYIDVFEKLSPEQVEKYKLLDGFEREKWLIMKRQEFRKLEEKNIIIEEMPETSESEMPEFNDRRKGMEFCFNVYKLNPKYLLKEGTKVYKIAQYWGFDDEVFRKYKLYGEI